MNKRIVFLIVSFATIGTGLFVRLKKAWFPDAVNLYLGDILYAFMMFYIVSFFAIRSNAAVRGGIALAVCFCVEVLQLYQAPWITTIRQTLPGRLILGSGFLWSDLLAYSIGVAAAYLFDKFVISRQN